MSYQLPEHRTWAPLKIVAAEVATKTMRIVKDGEIVHEEVPVFRVESIHVDPQYGARPTPYENVLSARSITHAFKEPRKGQMLGFEISDGPQLMKAADAVPEHPDTLTGLADAAVKMTGAIVMGQVIRTTKAVGPDQNLETADALNNRFEAVPNRNIEVVTIDGPQPVTIPWGSIAAFMTPPPAGMLVEVTLDATGQTISVCRAGSRWEELQADVRDRTT